MVTHIKKEERVWTGSSEDFPCEHPDPSAVHQSSSQLSSLHWRCTRFCWILPVLLLPSLASLIPDLSACISCCLHQEDPAPLSQWCSHSTEHSTFHYFPPTCSTLLTWTPNLLSQPEKPPSVFCQLLPFYFKL